MLCDDLEGWDGGEQDRLKRTGICVYVWLILFIVQQKLTQHCKASILLPPLFLKMKVDA